MAMELVNRAERIRARAWKAKDPRNRARLMALAEEAHFVRTIGSSAPTPPG